MNSAGGPHTHTGSLPELVRRETDDGLSVVRFLVDMMDAEIEGAKTTDRLAAARELLDRGFGKPFTAVESSGGSVEDDREASSALAERIFRALGKPADGEGEGAENSPDAAREEG